MIPGTRLLAAVLAWKPLAAAAVGTAMWLALVERPSPLLLSVAATAVAAATPFVLDDTAAATLESSPATLRQRRGHRVALILPLIASWWAVAFTIVSRSTVDLALAAHTLQLVTLVGIGVAVASTTSNADSDRARGGTTGSLAVIICFGTAFLPERSLQLVPVDPEAPDAGRRLIVVLIVAVAIQLSASGDPARRTMRRHRPILVPARAGDDAAVRCR